MSYNQLFLSKIKITLQSRLLFDIWKIFESFVNWIVITSHIGYNHIMIITSSSCTFAKRWEMESEPPSQ